MASYVKNKVFLSLIVGQLFYYASHSFGWAVFPIYLLANGFQMVDLAWFYLVVFVTIIVSLLSVRREETRWMMVKGLMLRVLMLLFIFKLLWDWQLWVVAMFYGAFWGLFFVTFNIRYFELTRTGGMAFASAITAATGPLVSIFVPLITGFIAGSVGHGMSFFVSVVLLFGAYAAFRNVPKKKVDYDIAKSLKSVASLRKLLFIDGFWQMSYYILIPAITVEYLTKPISYGAFISYVGVVGVLASFVLSKLADKYQNRSIFIYPSTIFMAAFTFAAAFTGSLWSWMVIVGIFSFFRSMATPLMMTVTLDVKGELNDTMLGREFVITIGRLVGVLVILVIYYISRDFRIALMVTGFVAMFYPFVLFKTGVYENVDKRMRYEARNRFNVMVKLWYLSPVMFFPKLLRRKWQSLRALGRELQINRLLKRD